LARPLIRHLDIPLGFIYSGSSGHYDRACVATQLSTSQPYSPVYAEIAVRVRELAVRQGLETGDRLPAERELARLLGVSRTSLREALTALRVDGEIEVRRGDGIYLLRTPGESVPPIPATLREQHPGLPALGEVRNALEALAAELAAVRRTDADLVGMVEAIRTMDAAVAGGEDPVEGDRMFHAAILQAAHNPALAALLEQISEGALRIAAASLARTGQPPRSLGAHRLILDAIVVRDSELASRLMRKHLELTGEIAQPLAGD
jgi:GntR family transcriptional repressor for pyruvate dehydrogenase complex